MPSNLNPSQQQAVESPAKSLLIVAGPGAGKTHTLTGRIISFSRHLKSPQKILALTFTRKAAGEMMSRLKGENIDLKSRVFIGTFHQFCLFILEGHNSDNFTVASDDECLSIAKETWPDLSSGEYKKRLESVSRWKSTEFDSRIPDDVQKFNAALRKKNRYDFDDLLLETFRLFSAHPKVLAQTQKSYPYVFVDEYQDMNRIQYELLKRLVGKGGSITAIGDPNQAIYGFRGSDVRFFHSFCHDFLGAEVLYLTENYRNTKDVLSASSQIIRHDADTHVPRQVARIHGQGLLTVHESATDKAEAEYVVHTIEKLVGGTSMFSQDSGRVGRGEEGEISFGDIAVLYRLKSQARELKKAFERSGMPFHITGDVSAEKDIGEDLLAQRHIEPDIDAEKVSLMTLHASKGLEFSCVFICGCEEHLLPLDLMNMTSDTGEERRLFYVGMTRAKCRLYLLHSQKRMLYGQKMSNPPSRFLSDIEESLKNYSSSEFRRKEKTDDGQLSLF